MRNPVRDTQIRLSQASHFCKVPLYHHDKGETQ